MLHNLPPINPPTLRQPQLLMPLLIDHPLPLHQHLGSLPANILHIHLQLDMLVHQIDVLLFEFVDFVGGVAHCDVEFSELAPFEAQVVDEVADEFALLGVFGLEGAVGGGELVQFGLVGEVEGVLLLVVAVLVAVQFGQEGLDYFLDEAG